jgi:hypothetical protein
MTRVCVGVRIQQLLSYPQRPDQPWGLSQSLSQWVRGAVHKRTKRTGPETDVAPLCLAEVTRAWSCTPLCRFVALCFIKHSLALILWNCHIAYLPNTAVITIFAHDRSSGLSGWRTCVFGRFRVRISTRRLAMYTDIFGGFSQSVRAYAELILQIRVRQLLSLSFPVLSHCPTTPRHRVWTLTAS